MSDINWRRDCRKHSKSKKHWYECAVPHFHKQDRRRIRHTPIKIED